MIGREKFAQQFAGAVQLALQKWKRLQDHRRELAILTRRTALHSLESDRRRLELYEAIHHDGQILTAAIEDVGAVLYQLYSPPTPGDT